MQAPPAQAEELLLTLPAGVLSFEDDGTVTQFAPKARAVVLREWASFDNWLTSEIVERMQ